MQKRSWIPTLAIVVALSMMSATAGAQAPGQTRTITGSVRDSVSGQPLNAGSVTVRGTRIGGVIREDGQFTVNGAPAGDTTIVVRALGFRGRDIRVPATTNTVTVALARDVLRMEQVVVTGAATTIERRNAPNAVSVIDAA